MAKTIVTHMAPDLDAISSAWLIKKYLVGWHEAEMEFVPAGTTLNGAPPDEDPDIIHVDTGLGMFDHHQLKDDNLCAAKRVFNHLKEKKLIKEKDLRGVSKLIEYVTLIDNFKEVYFVNPTDDIYDFMLHQTIEGLKSIGKNNHQVCEIVFDLLEASLRMLSNKIKAEEEIKKGLIFESKWGKSLAMETGNEEAMKIALKQDFRIVIRKDPAKGNIRIKSFPDEKIDLAPVYEKVKELDPAATWFLHVSGHMLLNGSSKNPTSTPSKLPLSRVIEIIKEIR